MKTVNTSLVQDHFGVIVSKWRIYRGWSQTELARRAGVTPNYISQIEGGHRKPSYDTIVVLAKALNCSLQINFIPNDMGILINDK